MFDFRSCRGPVPENIKLIAHSTTLLNRDQGTRSWRWTCPCCADKHPHLAMRPALLTGSMLPSAILGQVRDQYWGAVYYVKKGQKFACLLEPAKSVFNPWKYTKTPFLEKKVCCIFPDRRFPQWQVSHSKLYPQLCLWDLQKGLHGLVRGGNTPICRNTEPIKAHEALVVPLPSCY